MISTDKKRGGQLDAQRQAEEACVRWICCALRVAHLALRFESGFRLRFRVQLVAAVVAFVEVDAQRRRLGSEWVC